MPERLLSLKPEPLQATPQVNHRTGIPAFAAWRRHTALVQSLAIAVLDVMPSRSSSAIVRAKLRAKASART